MWCDLDKLQISVYDYDRPEMCAPAPRRGLEETLGGRAGRPPGVYPRGLAARPGGSRLEARCLLGVIGLPLGLGARRGVIALAPLGLAARRGVKARPAGLGARFSLLPHDGVRCSGGRGSCGDAMAPPPDGRRLADEGLSNAAPPATLRGRILELCSSLEIQVFGFRSMITRPTESRFTIVAGSQSL